MPSAMNKNIMDPKNQDKFKKLFHSIVTEKDAL